MPFGEYLPFQRFLESLGLQQLTKQRGGFLAGDRRRLIAVPGAPLGAAADLLRDHLSRATVMPKGRRPGWIINVTNDGWFGISSGPYQHFQQARVRAIEEGLPLVRAANTGISAVVDPVGRIVNSLPLGSEGVIDSPLPQADRRPDLCPRRRCPGGHDRRGLAACPYSPPTAAENRRKASDYRAVENLS